MHDSFKRVYSYLSNDNQQQPQQVCVCASVTQEFFTQSSLNLLQSLSSLIVVKELISIRDFSEDQISGLEKFEKETLKSRQIKEVANKVWECDDRLPEGFQVRVGQGQIQKTFYLARDGSQFSTHKCQVTADYHAREGLSRE